MRALIRVGLLLLAWTQLAPPAVLAEDVSAADVRGAIDRAVRLLRESQEDKGNWPKYAHYKGGTTSLCALALLNAGLTEEDPTIKRALDNLRVIGMPGTVYATSLQTMVFCRANPSRYRLRIKQNVDWLQNIQITNKRGLGGWSYDAGGRSPDNSNSQFAVLALHEAARVGILVDRKVWERSVEYWKGRQLKNGAWGYRTNSGKGSMTCAGIGSLIMANRNLTQGDASVLNGKVACCTPHKDDDSIQKGLAWMARNFAVTHHPHEEESQTQAYLHYYLYAIERIGRLSGQRFIGEHDWYREGSSFLLSTQQLNGGWTTPGESETVSTALALLFLAKGRRPVLVSKLKRKPDDDWNRHRSDIGNLTHYVEQRWGFDMTWQTVDQKAAGVKDLLQSPVLFLSGRDSLKLGNAEKQALREYVNQGGFLFAEACCGGQAFDQQFRQLMAELFPDNPLRLLPADHPVWFADQRVDPKYIRPLYGIDTCCRTSIVYCPQNLGCYWELYRGSGLQYPAAIQAEMEAVLAIGANVVAYATDRVLREKLDEPIMPEKGDGALQGERGNLRIAKLMHGGGSDDAPAALANLLRSASQALPLRVDTSRLLVPPTDESLPDYPILFVHGRRDFSWSTAQKASLAEFVKNGGVIFGDAICASPEFADAARREFQSAFPDFEWKKVPHDHPIFTAEFKGYDIPMVKVRRPRQRTKDGSLRSRVDEIKPALEGIEVDGRFVVLFSPYDMSCALESSASTDCEGYLSEDAARLGTNIILYAVQQ